MVFNEMYNSFIMTRKKNWLLRVCGKNNGSIIFAA